MKLVSSACAAAPESPEPAGGPLAGLPNAAGSGFEFSVSTPERIPVFLAKLLPGNIKYEYNLIE